MSETILILQLAGLAIPTVASYWSGTAAEAKRKAEK